MVGLRLQGAEANSAGLALPAAAAEFDLKLAHFLPTANGMHSDFIEPWARDLEACSNGPVAVEILPAGTQLGNPAKLYDALRAGVVDITQGLGGIRVGPFSPTEAAAIGALGAGLVALFRGVLSRKVLWVSATETVALTGMIFLITTGATLFNDFIETTGLPRFLITAIGSAGLGTYTVLLIIVAFSLVPGGFMDAMAMIFLTVPFIFPVVNALGLDPIWFGVLVVSVAAVGLITPPTGMNLFVLRGVVPGLKASTVMRGVLAFLVADITRLALLIAFPALALWLPGLRQ